MLESEARHDFDVFVRGHWTTLMSIAVAVSGSRWEAEDLVQTALTNAYPRWRSIRPDQALAYLRRSILNANISRWRRHRGDELSVADPPDSVTREDTRIEERLDLLPIMRALPARQCAVLVLRYLCDLPDVEIARTLRISTGTVRSQAARGLATLRRQRTETLKLEVTR